MRDRKRQTKKDERLKERDRQRKKERRVGTVQVNDTMVLSDVT